LELAAKAVFSLQSYNNIFTSADKTGFISKCRITPQATPAA
jgi:hypothetical protein